MPDIDDPFRPVDVTVLRPRPGAGKRGGAEAANPWRPAPVAVVAPAEEPLPAVREVQAYGLNPLVQAAMPLLVLAGQLRGTLAGPDAAAIRRHALDEIRRFEERARASGVPTEVVRAARYALCATLDEAVLSTPWGSQSEWAQQTLLVALHREAWGGEKFFEMLERISPDPPRHIDLMELLYLCIAFGFAGKYQVIDRGHSQLAEIQHALYRRVRAHRGTPQPDLSIHWKGLEDRRNPVIRYVPWWVVGAAALAVLAIAFVIYYSRLGSAAAPLHAALSRIGVEHFSAQTSAAPAAGPTLKQLLAAEEARGALTVEEDGGRSIITLGAGDLFGSGSATVNPAIRATVRSVAAALDRVPGRVLVVGHTDDQPLTSLRYRDNFELSRERAVSVVKLLQAGVSNPARIEWTGAGSSEPRYRPESDAANRARNRRVEILHVSGS
jgi:type VI secretion system protein ImpK